MGAVPLTHALAWIGVAVLGAGGAWARFRLDGFISGRWPGSFPTGTLAVNVTGSFALGVLVGLSVTGDLMLVLGTGLLGGYTTFSTWMFESERLGEHGEARLLWLNLVGSTLAGVAAAGLGWLLGAALA